MSQIVSVEKVEIVFSDQKRKSCEVAGSLATITRAINVYLVGGKNIELAFDSEEGCIATLKMLRMALKPLLVKKPLLPGKESATPKKPRPLTVRRKPRNPDNGPSRAEEPPATGGS